MRPFLKDVLLVATLLVLPACQNQPLTVASIQLGRSLNSDNSVGNHTTRFKPDDTVYAAVLTERSGASTIVARWIYGGRTIGETSREVSYRGAAATEFHLQYAGNLPPGEYAVEILVDGQSAGKREFRVEP